MQVSWLTKGLCPVSLYFPGDTDSTNFPLLPTVTVNLRPAELVAVTCPGRATGAPGDGPPTRTRVPAIVPATWSGCPMAGEARN